MKKNIFLFLITFGFHLDCLAQNSTHIIKQKTLLNFEFGMSNKEIVKHLSNLLYYNKVYSYRLNENGYHVFSYSYEIDNINSQNTADAVIELKANPYLTNFVATISPPIDSVNQKITGTQKLYQAFKKYYGTPSKPLTKAKREGTVFSEAIWNKGNFSIRWFQYENGNILIFYNAEGIILKSIKQQVAKERGYIEVEQKY